MVWVQNAAYTFIIRALSQFPLRFSAPPPRPRCHPMRVERGLQHPQFSKSPAALGLSLQRLPTMPILRVDCASLDRLRPSGTVHATDPARAPPTDDSRVIAPYPGVLGARRTLFDGVSNAGQRHVGFLTLHLARGGRDEQRLHCCFDLMQVRSAVRVSKKSKTLISGYFSKLSMSKKSKPPIGGGLWTPFFGLPVTATAKPLRCYQWLTASAYCPW